MIPQVQLTNPFISVWLIHVYIWFSDEASSSFRSSGTDKTSSDEDGDKGKAGKRRRTAFTRTQLHCLEGLFTVCPYPDADTRIKLAEDNDISPTKVQVTKNIQ